MGILATPNSASEDTVLIALRILYILSLILSKKTWVCILYIDYRMGKTCILSVIYSGPQQLEIHTKSNSHEWSHRRPKPNIPVFRRPGSLPGSSISVHGCRCSLFRDRETASCDAGWGYQKEKKRKVWLPS